MKTIRIMILAVISAQLAAASPKVFEGGRQLHNGQGDNQASAVYEFTGPYALRWNLRDVKPRQSADALAAYWEPHTAENPPWVSVKVVDAVSRKVVAHEVVTAWESSLQVEGGGKHYLVVTGERHVAWTIWGKQGMLAANAEGIRKATPEDTGSLTVEQLARELTALLAKKHQGEEYQKRAAAVQLIQSRSSSVDDFSTRWEAYSKLMGWE